MISQVRTSTKLLRNSYNELMTYKHVPVLLNESITNLNIKCDGIYVDATLGGGGHSYHILKELSNAGHLYCFDQDAQAIEASQSRLATLSQNNYTLIHSNFKNMKGELALYNAESIDGVLFDLGVSSFQLDIGERGFSYNYDALLDMRMDQSNPLTARIVVNNYSEEKLAKIIFDYGEEKYARVIARNIVKQRLIKPIDTTFELVDIIKESLPMRVKMEKGHPAKRTFQAIRIEVNDELGILRQSVSNAMDLLKPGGRVCVITFHSLEDRIIKDLFKEKSTAPAWNRNMPLSMNQEKVNYRLVSKKPIMPKDYELEDNNRAHSAKLRVIERI